MVQLYSLSEVSIIYLKYLLATPNILSCDLPLK